MPSQPTRRAPRKPSIPGYEIEEEIGRGATGVVYRARQAAVDREVALKVLHSDLAAKPRVVKRLQREARTTARLAHPHIVKAIDMGEVDGLWWYAMELVDGPSLALRLRQEGRISERAALRLFIPIVEALRHAWEHGVVHRDIKPANILIDQSGVAYLADLGLAFREEDPLLTKTGGTLGTPHYISPEQARDPSTVDIRSDIWSFGATLFHAVCGRAPFSGESMAEVLSGVLYGRVPDPRSLEPGLAPGLVLVLRKCLQRDPAQRYQTPHELLLDLERVRERRQPKVSRFELEPVGEGGGPLRTYLIGAAVVLFGVAGLWLAVERPWAEDVQLSEEPQGGPDEVDPLAFLRGEVVARVELLPAEALERLEELRDTTPEKQVPEWRELRDALRARARGEAERAKADATVAVDHALSAGDLEAAERALGPDLDAALFAGTGFHLVGLPAFLSSLEPWLELKQHELDIERLRGERATQEMRHWFETVLAPEVDRLESMGRWREAFEALELEDAELVSQALPTGLVGGSRELDAGTLRTVRRLMEERRSALLDAWLRIDGSLSAWIEGRERALVRELETGGLRGGTSALLRADFAGELEERGTRLESLVESPAPQAVVALELGAQRLAKLEDALDREEAQQDFATLEAVTAPLWSARQYPAVETLWRRFQSDLESLRSERSGAWRDTLEQRVDLRIREARWLEGLLEAAARTISAMDSESLRLRGSSHSVTGRVVAGNDPLRAGFQLVSDDGFRWYFHPRQMAWRDIENRLLSWPSDSAELEDPDDRLKRALLRYHEGDFAAAREALESGPTPGDYAGLTRDLRERLDDSEHRDRTLAAERETAAAELLSEVDRAVQVKDRDARLVAVEGLLRRYREVSSVQERESELKGLQRELEDPEPAPTEEVFDRAFGADQLDLSTPGRVRMTFEFDGTYRGAWRPGTWVDWRAPAGGASWQALSEREGPSLELPWPLDPRTGEIVVEVEFEQPFDAGAPALFVISVLGYHFGLVGTGLPADDPQRRLGGVASTQGLDALIAEVRSGRAEGEVSYLTRSRTHRVRVRIEPGRHIASLDVQLVGGAGWRKVFDHKRFPRPREVSDRIELRSWESIVLREATIEVSRF